MSRPVIWPDQVVARARELREFGLGERSISKRLHRELGGKAPSEHTVRDWIRRGKRAA